MMSTAFRIIPVVAVLLACLWGSAPPAAAQSKKMTILEYYNSFVMWKKLGFEHLIDRKIGPEGRQEHASRGAYMYDIIVDAPNGFLQYATGCSCHQEIYSYAIFKTAGGDVYLSASGRNLNFYKFVGANKWIDETKTVVPEIGLGAFLAEGASPESIPANVRKCSAIFYAVPRYGTVVTAELRLYSKHQDDPERSEQEWKRLEALRPAFRKAYRYTKLNLPWDRERGVITIGKKE
ncbi:MAG TPA: hypothetical protein PKM65_16885 [Spirochaetota bacterium]|nr:hypothetical protein [Spirochaetota bacterium]HNT12144.1 hypothetical protein [Spirochaetota bacterium]